MPHILCSLISHICFKVNKIESEKGRRYKVKILLHRIVSKKKKMMTTWNGMAFELKG